MSEIKRQIENEDPAFLPDTTEGSSSADFEMFIAAVWREEDRMLQEEGAFFAGGQYYADAFDAEIQRRWLAEKLVREQARERVQRMKQNLNSTFLPKELRSA